MDQKRSIFEKLGPVIGVVLLIYTISSMVQYYNGGLGSAETLATEQNSASPATTAITATVPLSATTALTATSVMTTSVVTVTAISTTTSTTETATTITSTTGLTATSSVTPTANTALTTTTALSSTELVSSTTAVTATAHAALPAPSAAVVAAITKGGCMACHTIPAIQGAVGKVGPDLSNIGNDAATRIKGYTAEQYIRESLLKPNAFIAPKCPFGSCVPGAMPANLEQTLTKAEMDTIVEYLLTLRTPSQ